MTTASAGAIEVKVPQGRGRELESCDSLSTLGASELSEGGSLEGRGKLRKGAFRKGGTAPTALCLCKSAVGAGVLSIAAHAAEVGLVFQASGLVLGAVLTLTSIQMVSRASIQTGCWSYEDINDELMHPAMSLLTGFINVCKCIGAGAGYLIVCGQVMQVLTGIDEGQRRLFVVAVGVFVCAPLSLVREVSFMRHLALLSVCALFLLVCSVVWYIGHYGVEDTVTIHTLMFGPGQATVFTFMNALNNVVFAYDNQCNVPQLTGELTPQPSMSRMLRVSLCSTFLCFALYLFTSVSGVLAFGVGDGQLDSLVLDLLPARREWNVMLSMGAVIFSVLTCFQFHVYPIRQFAAYVTRKARARDAGDEASDVKYCGRSLTRWLDIACALGCVAFIILVAVVVTRLQTMVNFVGAFASAYTSYVVPPLWIIQILRREKGFSWFDREALLCLLIFAIGAFFFVFGTFTAVAAALEADGA